jgi:arylsulfatase A-like enzyme
MLSRNLKIIFAIHFFLILIIQIENALMFYKVSWWKLLGGQFQNFLFSALLTGIYYLVRRNKLLIRILHLVFFFLLIFISMNQVFFQIFHENFALTFITGFKLTDAANYWGSFTGELKEFHLFNLAYLIIVTIIFLRNDWVTKEKLEWRNARTVNKVSLSILLLITFSIQFLTSHSEINSHAFVTFFRGIQLASVDKPKVKRIDPEKLYQLKFGTPTSENTDILSYNQKILSQKKNIIFIILESVGSMQVFENGKINPEDLPYLSENKESIFSFTNLQNNFPGTTRSHIPIITGGQTITWGSVFKELLYPYTGPTLASEFNNLGKNTALISAMGLDFENLASFYNNLGFNYVYDSDRETNQFKNKNSIQSWGIDERVTLKRFEQWYDKNSNGPFYLQLLTNTTHHPYGAPKDFAHGVKTRDSYSKYRMSLRYTDHFIKLLVLKLKKLNIHNDTVIYISGDHGEAFGKHHTNNFAHKSSVYEETIKNFLLIYSPAADLKPGSSQRRGSLGDIMPTILAPHLDRIPTGAIGQNLNSPGYKEKLAFFHKNTPPEIWGIRDGQWKYFAEKVGGKNGRLYNLNLDPHEQTNILANHKGRAKIYDELITNWFVQTNDSFVKHLKGFEYLGDAGLALTDVNSYGPKRIAVGTKPEGLNFTTLKEVHPEELLTIWTHGVSYPVKTKLRYEFTSPTGEKHGFTFTHKKDWSTVFVYDKPKRPRKTGIWHISIFDLKDKEIISTQYKVTPKAKLHWSSTKKKSELRQITFGIKKNKQRFQELKIINPSEDMAVLTLGIPYWKDKSFVYQWISPSGKKRDINFTIRKGWDSFWVYHEPVAPMEVGQWTLNIIDSGKKVISGQFKVDQRAPLHIPIKF